MMNGNGGGPFIQAPSDDRQTSTDNRETEVLTIIITVDQV